MCVGLANRLCENEIAKNISQTIMMRKSYSIRYAALSDHIKKTSAERLLIGKLRRLLVRYVDSNGRNDISRRAR